MQIESENPQPLELTAALLIYKSGGYGASKIAVTRHKVERGVIQPGETVDVAIVKAMLDGTSANEGDAPKLASSYVWMQSRVLAESIDRIVWWTEPGVRTIFVAGKATKAWLPSLVWAGHKRERSLYLWAGAGNKCPTAKTIVYRPRFGPTDGMNHIHDNCAVCLGSMNPKRFTPNGWMESFFDTNFKTNDGLPPKSYAPQKIFKKVGALQAQLARLPSRE